MIFVDTNVFMYAVGRPHSLRAPAQQFFANSMRDGVPLLTSAEVLQELTHAYLPVNRSQTLDSAFTLIKRAGVEVWPPEADDVVLARRLHRRFPALGTRDLCHLASCQRRGVKEVKTFDYSLTTIAGALLP